MAAESFGAVFDGDVVVFDERDLQVIDASAIQPNDANAACTGPGILPPGYQPVIRSVLPLALPEGATRMSCAILPTADHRAVLTNSAGDWVFGPIFPSPSDAAAFIRWLGRDPQDVLLAALLGGGQPDCALESLYQRWLAHPERPLLPDPAELSHG